MVFIKEITPAQQRIQLDESERKLVSRSGMKNGGTHTAQCVLIYLTRVIPPLLWYSDKYFTYHQFI